MHNTKSPIDTTGEPVELAAPVRDHGALERSAVISDDGVWRYELRRRWGTGPEVGWVMLNPSTADASKDDPTIKRCMAFTESWGYRAMRVVNLTAFRSTDPKKLRVLRGRTLDATRGPENERYVSAAVAECELLVAAWGGSHRGILVLPPRMLVRPLFESGRAKCLGTTLQGDPNHPLYLPSTATLHAFQPGP